MGILGVLRKDKKAKVIIRGSRVPQTLKLFGEVQEVEVPIDFLRGFRLVVQLLHGSAYKMQMFFCELYMFPIP